jgi:uncharacterized protein (TIGR03435 family)
MNRLLTGAALSVIGTALALPGFGQTPNGQPSFEVATVKPAATPDGIKTAERAGLSGGGTRTFVMMGSRGGPGTPDPGRYTCDNCNMQMLLTSAYGVDSYQLSIPKEMDNLRFDITAKVPEKATKDEFKLMLQNLLAERFKLKVHKETKEGQMYELTVAKGGVKMKESVEEPPKPVETADAPGGPSGVNPTLPVLPAGGRFTLDKDGFPVVPKVAGAKGPMMMMMNGRMRMTAEKQSMEDIVKTLTRQVSRPVTDLTGLKAKYDFTLTWDGVNPNGNGGGISVGPGGRAMQMTVTAGGPGPGPGAGGGGGGASDGSTPLGDSSDKEPLLTIFGAVQAQLGLKLEGKKGPVESIIVDHVEKTPTEN